MFRIYFINFGYYSGHEAETVDGAKEIARKAGFESRIEDKEGSMVGSYSPLYGFKMQSPPLYQWS